MKFVIFSHICSNFPRFFQTVIVKHFKTLFQICLLTSSKHGAEPLLQILRAKLRKCRKTARGRVEKRRFMVFNSQTSADL